jgi:hypothetical protein
MEGNMNALQPRATASLAPQSLSEAMKFSELMANSTLVPAAFRGKPGDVLVAVQMGAELGLAPMQAIQNVAVINGKPAVYGDALLALVRASPVCVDVVETIEGDGDATVAVCIAKRRNSEPVTARFGVADAKRAGLWNKQGPWQQYPRRMLQMRARGFALRDAFPDVLRGLIAREEAEDIPATEAPREVPNLATHAAEGMRNAKADLIADGRAFRVVFPNGRDKLYATKPEAWAAIALAADRCGDLDQLARLEADNADMLRVRPGDEMPPALDETLEALAVKRATLPAADPLPEPEPAPVEVEAVAEPDGIEYVMAAENVGSAKASQIADLAARLREAADYGAALRIMDEEVSQKAFAWLKAKPAPRTLAALESITREKAAAEVQA